MNSHDWPGASSHTGTVTGAASDCALISPGLKHSLRFQAGQPGQLGVEDCDQQQPVWRQSVVPVSYMMPMSFRLAVFGVLCHQSICPTYDGADVTAFKISQEARFMIMTTPYDCCDKSINHRSISSVPLQACVLMHVLDSKSWAAWSAGTCDQHWPVWQQSAVRCCA